MAEATIEGLTFPSCLLKVSQAEAKRRENRLKAERAWFLDRRERRAKPETERDLPRRGKARVFSSRLAGAIRSRREGLRGNGVKNLKGSEAIPERAFRGARQNGRDPKMKIVNAGLLLLAAFIVCLLSGLQFWSMRKKEAVVPSQALTAKTALSAYFPALKKTPGDSDVYIYQGEEQGGNLLILGGTHPNEPAGFVTAVVLIENIRVSSGKVVILPRANNSGFTHSEPQEGNPQGFFLDTEGGPRWFRYGSRLTNPVHQWPDPSLYINPPGQKLSGPESRNLNRCYPGKKKGRLTEKVAFGIMELIRQEKIDLAVDLHEAAPEYPVINAIVFHENSADLAVLALMELQTEGFEFRLEASPPNLRGLSHREWGDDARVMAILLETANASHGRLKGKVSPSLIIDGKDKNYVKAAKLGRLFVPYEEEGIPLRLRVARHLAALKAILSSLKELYPEKHVEIGNIPSPSRVQERGLGDFLGLQK